MMIILQRERPILQPAKLNLHGLSVIVLMSALLLGGCTGGAVPRQPVTAMPNGIVSSSPAVLVAVDQPQSKSPVQSAPAQQVSEISMTTQQGGARQGVFLSLKNAVSTFAGKHGVAGSSDGSATRASFDAPKGITTDGIYLYIADLNNHTIRRVDAVSGAVTTIAGMAGMKGSSDGTGTAALFNRPYGITTDGINLYVTDSNNHCIRKIDIESAAVTTLAGGAGEVGYSDGAANQARFFIPEGITTDGANLYVADTHNHSVRKIELVSAAVTTFAGLSGSPGFADDAGIKARFSYPKGITTDGHNLYVVDFGNHRVRKIAIASAWVTTLAGGQNMTVESAAGSAEDITFNYPTGITSDGRNLFVADTFNRTVRKIVIASGTVTTLAGKADLEGALDATGSEARFKEPIGITTDGSHLFVTDSASHTVRKIR